MSGKILPVFIVVVLSILLILCIGCGSPEAESQPYGPPQVHFPEDEGAHPESGVEWWYLNSILTDSQGREYGAMVAYFNPGLKILSISDIEEERSLPEVSFSIPDYSEGTLDLRWGDNDRWFRTNVDSLTYHLEANGTEIGLNLDLSSLKPPLLVGGDGLIEWTDESSYYYSLTRLQLEGQIELSGKIIDVEGSGWMDHQWMDSLSERGWDWFSVQLDNNTEVIFWQIVNTDETIDSRDLTIMFPDNSVYHTRDLTMERVDSWVSTETGNGYGIIWRVQEEVHDLDLEIIVRYPEQEVRVLEDFEDIDIDFDFWEGGTTVSGHLAGEEVTGTGYAELVRMPTDLPENATNPWE
jgi:predicted secreted hydrolase